MRALLIGASVCLLAVMMGKAFAPQAYAAAQMQKKDYLTQGEADKIRDAGATGPRIALYASFAENRIKKIQYELAHIDPADQKRSERMNALLNGYAGCIDDAADLIDIGIEKQEDIRDGLKTFQGHLKGFLDYLHELQAKGADRDTYKDNLEDAIESTQDAMTDAENASKGMAPPPVRRRQ